LEQYWPGRMVDVARMFANVVSENELALVNACRNVVGDVDYSLAPETLDQIAEIIRLAVAGEARHLRVR